MWMKADRGPMGSVGLAPREGPKIVVMAPLILATDNCIARVLAGIDITRYRVW